MNTTLPLGLAILLGILMAGCGGDDTVAAGRTGVPIVDTVLDAIEDADRDALTPLWRLEDKACIDPRSGPPAEVAGLCIEGEEPGTLIPTFRFTSCSGSARGRANAEDLSDFILARDLSGVHAVFAATDENAIPANYRLIYGVAYDEEEPTNVLGYEVFLSEDQIVAIHVGCFLSPEALIESLHPADRIPISE